MQPLTASELEIWERILLVMQRLRASAVSKSGEEAPEGPHPVPGPHQFPVPTPSPVPPPRPHLNQGSALCPPPSLPLEKDGKHGERRL